MSEHESASSTCFHDGGPVPTIAVSPTIIFQLSTIAVAFAVAWSTIFMTCDENLHGGLCRTFSEIFSNIGFTITGNENGAVIAGIFLPIFVATISCYLIHLFCEPTRKVYRKNQDGEVPLWYKVWTRTTGGDLPVEFIAFLVIVFPVLWKVFVPLFTFCQGPSNYYHFCDESRGKALSVAIARSTGRASLMAMVWFLIPVSRQSPILVALGLSPIWGLKFHKWAGRVAIICGLVHSVVNIILYAFHQGRTRRDHIFFPKATCWRYFKPSDFQRPVDDPDWVTEECSLSWFMFTGEAAAFFMILLALTAFWFIRRRKYRVLYWTHVIFAALCLIFLMMHWGPASLWLGPGIIYYLAITSPHLIQALATYFRCGVKLTSVKLLGNSNFCCELTFPRGKYATREETNYSAQYVRICVPELSLLWYPFTVASTPDNPDKLCILFRRTGHFTSKLYERVQQTEKSPIVLVDAYYSSADWASHVVRHDKSLMVSGGVGVTPFLSVLQKMLKSIKEQEPEALLVPREVQFHWSCRDEGLIDHVFASHFFHLLREPSGEDYSLWEEEAPVTLKIVIHKTAKKGTPNGVDDAPSADENCQEASLEAIICEDSIVDIPEDTIFTTEDPEHDVFMKYEDMRGKELEIAHFPAKSYNKYVRNIPSILLVSTALLFGMWATWKTLTNHTSEHLFVATVPQAYPFYVSAVVAFAFGIFFECLYQLTAVHWNQHRRLIDRWSSSRHFKTSELSNSLDRTAHISDDSLSLNVHDQSISTSTGQDCAGSFDSEYDGIRELEDNVDSRVTTRDPPEDLEADTETLVGSQSSWSEADSESSAGLYMIPLDTTIRVSAHAAVRFRIVNERPNVPEMVSFLKDADIPAFFFCGPERLYDACRQEIGRQFATGIENTFACGQAANTVYNTGSKWHVSFYKEEFEM